MTVVFRTHGLLARADMRRGGQPRVTLWRTDWPDLSPAVTHALGEGGRPGRRVWVLDSDVWLGVVELPGSAVAGLSDKDLADPAAYEAEAISELRPAETVTAVQRRRMPDQDDQFVVAQAQRGAVAAVAKAVRGAGARLAGIGHPGGVPEALELDGEVNAAGDESWRRVEFWSDSVMVAESVAGRVGLIPLGIRPQGEWRKALGRHLGRGEQVVRDQTLIAPGVRVRGGANWRENTTMGGTARWLAAGEDAGDEDDGVPVSDLAQDASAQAFVAAWARRLSTIEPSQNDITPTLRPPKAPAARWPAVVAGVIALALAAGAVYYQRDGAGQRLTDLRGQLEDAQYQQKLVTDQRKQVNQAKADLRRKQQAVESLERQLEQLSRRRAVSKPASLDRKAAMAAMMTAMTRSVAEDCVIQSIDHGSPQHEITGFAMTPEAASGLARDLSGQLKGQWSVSPARIEPHERPDRLVWRFSITMEPAAGVGVKR